MSADAPAVAVEADGALAAAAAAPGGVVLPSWVDFSAGTVAGIAITLVGHPFDTAKVRLQTQAVRPGQGAPFKGGWDCAVRTVRNEGFRALYKGMSGPLTTVPLINALVFSSYEQGKRYLGRRGYADADGELGLAGVTLAGGWAGLVNSAVVGPVELVKSRLQVQYEAVGAAKKEVRGPADVVRSLVRERGLRGLLLGTGSTLWREVPAYMLQFYVYELTKRVLTPEGGTASDLTAPRLMTAGALAGVAAWVASYPQDIIKSRIQVQPLKLPAAYPASRALGGLDFGMLSAGRAIYAKGGLRGFWVGFGPCVGRALPANAVGFLTYEVVSDYLNGLKESRK